MPKIGDIFRGGYKIGEIWSGSSPNGLCILVGLAILCLPFIPIVLGIWSIKEGIDHQVEANRIANIRNDPHYYTERAKEAKISIVESPTVSTHEDGHTYFTVRIRNGDQKDHDASLLVQLDADVKPPNDSEYHPHHFEISSTISRGFCNDCFTIPANSTISKEVRWFPVNDNNLGYDGIKNIKNIHVSVQTIDGYPAVDPRDVLPKLLVSAQLHGSEMTTSGSVLFTCQVDVTNTDSVSHTVNPDLVGYDATFYDGNNTEIGNPTLDPFASVEIFTNTLSKTITVNLGDPGDDQANTDSGGWYSHPLGNENDTRLPPITSVTVDCRA